MRVVGISKLLEFNLATVKDNEDCSTPPSVKSPGSDHIILFMISRVDEQ